MTVSTLKETQQTVHCSTLAEALLKAGLHEGMQVVVSDNGYGVPAHYNVYPAATKTQSLPHVANCTGSPTCQLIDDYSLNLAWAMPPAAHAVQHITGGNDVIPTATTTKSGLIPAVTASTPSVMLGNGVLPFWGLLSNGYIATATINPDKFTVGTANYIISSDGSAAAWSAMSDAIHGSRGGGSLHATATTGSTGFMPAQGTSAGYLRTDGGGGLTWAATATPSAHNQTWSTITSVPALTTTLPLTGGGTLGALTLGINAATITTPGSMGATDKIIVDSIPRVADTDIGKMLVAAGTDLYALATASSHGINTGSGTRNFLPKYTANGTTLGNSVAADYGSGLLIGNGYFGSAFTAGGGYKHVTLGTSYFDGTNYVTTGVGTNAVAEMVTDTAGIGFLFSPSTGNTTRVDAPNDFMALERMRINDAGLAVNGSVTVSKTSDGYVNINSTNSTHASFVLQSNATSASTGTLYTWESGAVLEALTNTGLHGFGGVIDPSANVDIGNSLRIRYGSPSAGKLWQASDANGNGVWSSSLTGLTGLTFVSTAVMPTITQSPVAGTPTSLVIEAQSTTTPDWYVGEVGNVIINGGKNTVGSTGKIELGYSGNNGAYAVFDQTGASLGNVTAANLKMTGAASATVTDRPPVTFYSVTWTENCQVDSTSSSPVNLDFGSLYNLDGVLPNSSQYHVDAKIMYAGAAARTFEYTGTWTKNSGGVLANNEYNSFGNGGGYSVGSSQVGANTMRIIVGVPSSGVRVTAIVHVTRVPLP